VDEVRDHRYGSGSRSTRRGGRSSFEEIDRLDHQMSNYSETSELTYINRNAARENVIVEKSCSIPETVY